MEEQQPPSGEPPKAAPKSRALWIVVAVIVVVVVVLSAAVLGGLFGPPEETVLKIGTVLSLTGTSGLEAFGPKNLQGALLAAGEINAAGGVLGRQIQVISEDDNGVTTTARDRAQKLVTTNRVDAILGAVGSGFCAAVLEVTKPNQVVQVSASCTSPIFSNLTYTDGWFFRTAPSDALQGVVAANYAHDNNSWRDVAVVGNDNPYGRGLANVFATEFESLGDGANAEVRIFAENSADYSSDLQALFDLFDPDLPEALYLVNYPTDGLKIMRDWAEEPAWSGIDIMFSEGVLDETLFIDLLDNQGITLATMQGFEGSAPGAYLGIVGDLYDDFLTRYRARYGATADPGLFTANAYDAVYLIAAATQRAGTATAAGIKANLRTVASPDTGDTIVSGGQWNTILTEIAAGRGINYEGASGSVNVDSLGDPLSGYGIWGIDANQNATTKAFFNEATVVDLVENAPPAPTSARPEFMLPVEWMAIPGRSRVN
jgi:branched-chain amino acid transport system substrate-binding protein